MNNIAIPSDFQYKDVFLKGKPSHEGFDPFCIRHPRMNVGRRAKIFSPFDALRGFNEAVASKNIIYCDHIDLSEDDKKELDRRLNILQGLTYNGRVARENHVNITVVYYEVCADKNSESYGVSGRYQTITGICRNVDIVYRIIHVDNVRIPFEDIYQISNADGIFTTDRTIDYLINYIDS